MSRPATAAHPPLAVDRLRRLTLDPSGHPRAQPHFSAASGLVCAFGRAYVIGDDEQQLAVYRDRESPGELHPLLAGELPADKPARKRRKADLEALFRLPDAQALVAMGSGSTPVRERGVSIVLAGDGGLPQPPQPFDLAPLYRPLRQRHGAINIEGAFVLGDELWLLNRGHPSAAGNLVLRYRLDDFIALMQQRRPAELLPRSVLALELGTIDGVALGFTDGTALPDGGWVFSAVAEDSADSVADGACCGAVIGIVSPEGRLQAMHRLASSDKVEGIDVQRRPDGLVAFMVTDADDPAQPAWLLSARLD